MCTVTYIPLKNSVCFTSNRDEQHDRPPAILPAIYEMSGSSVLFPRDPLGGGTWIAAHKSGNAAVLLNGAWQPHKPEPSYRISRGLILLDLISGDSPVRRFEESDLKDIEPFTIILYDNRMLFAGYWDGFEKKIDNLDACKSYIWSSVTLYDADIREKRKQWFSQWIAVHRSPRLDDILYFHRFGGDGDLRYNLNMNRDNHLYTNSISAMQIFAHKTAFHYHDMRTNTVSVHSLALRKQTFVTL
jgi:hypothetical protein